MKDIIVSLSPEVASKTGDALLQVIDQEVADFSRFMEGLGDWKFQGALLKQERVLLKTYLVQKLRGRVDGP